MKKVFSLFVIFMLCQCGNLYDTSVIKKRYSYRTFTAEIRHFDSYDMVFLVDTDGNYDEILRVRGTISSIEELSDMTLKINSSGFMREILINDENEKFKVRILFNHYQEF